MLESEAVFRYLTPHRGGEAGNSTLCIFYPWANTLKFVILLEMKIIEPLPR